MLFYLGLGLSPLLLGFLVKKACIIGPEVPVRPFPVGLLLLLLLPLLSPVGLLLLLLLLPVRPPVGLLLLLPLPPAVKLKLKFLRHQLSGGGGGGGVRVCLE